MDPLPPLSLHGKTPRSGSPHPEQQRAVLLSATRMAHKSHSDGWQEENIAGRRVVEILCRCRRISEGLNQMAQGLQSQTPS